MTPSATSPVGVGRIWVGIGNTRHLPILKWGIGVPIPLVWRIWDRVGFDPLNLPPNGAMIFGGILSVLELPELCDQFHVCGTCVTCVSCVGRLFWLRTAKNWRVEIPESNRTLSDQSIICRILRQKAFSAFRCIWSQLGIQHMGDQSE